MDILLKRIAKLPTYTIGRLYINGLYVSDTLEDTDRGLELNMSIKEILSKKVYGETAIPTGTYIVSMDVVSPKFKNRSWAIPYGGKIPRLLNVPGFDGILIHPGTDASSTAGCLIPGKNTIKGKVTESLVTFHKIMKLLKSATSEIVITIE